MKKENAPPVGEHYWYNIPSKMVVRRWCQRCGVYSDGDQVWAAQFPPWKWDWQYIIPGLPMKVTKEEPPCVQPPDDRPAPWKKDDVGNWYLPTKEK